MPDINTLPPSAPPPIPHNMSSPAGATSRPGHRTISPHCLTGSPIMPTTADPHHRAPSLGEIHQELEQEQEAQVNRLLQMIRIQQQQLQALQVATGQAPGASPAVDDSTPTSERSLSFSNPISHHPQPSTSTSTPRSPSIALHPRGSFELLRSETRRSRTPSQTASPRMRATSNSGEAHDWTLGGRDESAFYQAETQTMARENHMLRQRIRELERQVNQMHENAASHRSSLISEEAPSLVSEAAKDGYVLGK